MPDIKELKNNLVMIARRCSDRKMQTGNGGNISARLNDKFMVVKASETSLADCNEESFIISDFKGNLIEGEKKPSRESLLHGALYKKFKRVNAIVHCHSPYAIAWASKMKPLPFVTYHAEQKLKSEVEVFDTESYAVSEKDIPKILDFYNEDSKFMGFLLKGHGLIALGKDLFEASYTADLIEETAKINILESVLTFTSKN